MIARPGDDDEPAGRRVLARMPPPLIDIGEPFAREGADHYHRRRDQYLSSHQLADFRKAPTLLRRKQLGVAMPEPESDYFTLGRAAHVLILEGPAEFARHYCVSEGPINPKTSSPFGSRTKAYAAWKAAEPREVIGTTDALFLANMARGVRDNKIAAGLLEHGAPELVLRGDYCGVPCQIRADWIAPHRGLVDLKSCASLDRFEDDARRYQYLHQLAFYREVIAATVGPRLPVYIVAVEKNEPFRCGVWRLSDGALGAARRENEAAIHAYRRCLESNEWPTGYEAMRELNWI